MSGSIGELIKGYCAILDELKSGYGLSDHAAEAMLREVGQDLRMWQGWAKEKAMLDEPATNAQKDYLRRLGIESRPGLTKKEASALIGQASETPKFEIERI